MKQMKQAFEDATQEFENKKIKQFKELVIKTLEKLEQKQQIHREIIKDIQILKKDIKDLSQGRLDRIIERQEADKKAKEVSCITITAGSNYSTNTWGNDYTINGYNYTGKFCSQNTSGTYTLSNGSIKYI